MLPHVLTHPALVAARSPGLQRHACTGRTATPQQRRVIGPRLSSAAEAVYEHVCWPQPSQHDSGSSTSLEPESLPTPAACTLSVSETLSSSFAFFFLPHPLLEKHSYS